MTLTIDSWWWWILPAVVTAVSFVAATFKRFPASRSDWDFMTPLLNAGIYGIALILSLIAWLIYFAIF